MTSPAPGVRYRLISQVGVGGMAVVWQCHHHRRTTLPSATSRRLFLTMARFPIQARGWAPGEWVRCTRWLPHWCS
ncbi:hypothetical protein ACQP2E_03940 [Actinoplanes sp. CA-015351]|uniref:hypothetical protein n=1 Tax=Actinoplanes sp. CA-015351 TaxID=3239897 RepID=UPI003D984EF9